MEDQDDVGSDTFTAKNEARAPGIFEALAALYTKPVKAMKMLKESASISGGCKNIAISYFATILIPDVYMALGVINSLRYVNAPLADFAGLLIFLSFSFLGVFIIILAYFVFSVITYIAAKVVGGDGMIVQQFYHLSYISIALAPLYILQILLVIILFPALSSPSGSATAASLTTATHVIIIISLAMDVLILLYALFLDVLSIREVYGLNTIKAIFSLLIPVSIAAILLVVPLMLMRGLWQKL